MAPARPAQTVACTEKDKALKISQLRNKCLTVITRWRLYKEHAEYTWSREDSHEKKLAGVAAWSDYVTEEEFNRLDTKRHYRDQYDRYIDYYAGGGQYERQVAERQAEEEKAKPPEPAPTTESTDAFSDVRQIDIDLMRETMDRTFAFARQPDPPAPPPVVAQPGCHPDPYASKTGSTVCGQKRPDDATRATMKAMEMPAPDFSEHNKLERAKLDRLNEAHLYWSQTGYFPWTTEFSPYEIEKDRIIPVEERWNEYNSGDPNNLETADFNERFFRSKQEYDAEFQRRHDEYLAAVKACGKSRPSHFKCRDKVMGTYYPGRFSLYDAAATRTHNDMQIAMPVLRGGGPVAGFVFHATHEWLGGPRNVRLPRRILLAV